MLHITLSPGKTGYRQPRRHGTPNVHPQEAAKHHHDHRTITTAHQSSSKNGLGDAHQSSYVISDGWMTPPGSSCSEHRPSPQRQSASPSSPHSKKRTKSNKEAPISYDGVRSSTRHSKPRSSQKPLPRSDIPSRPPQPEPVFVGEGCDPILFPSPDERRIGLYFDDWESKQDWSPSQLPKPTPPSIPTKVVFCPCCEDDDFDCNATGSQPRHQQPSYRPIDGAWDVGHGRRAKIDNQRE